MPATLDRRVEGVRGVRTARRFLQFAMLTEIHRTRYRLGIVGVDYPKDRGSWIPLVAGRQFNTGHFETIADEATGLVVGETLRLGHDDYTVVGISRGQVDLSGDPIVFMTLPDAIKVANSMPSEAVVLARAASKVRGTVLPPVQTNAVMITLGEGADADEVRSRISAWPDVTVVKTDQQREWVLNDMLGPLRRQIISFTAMMLAVAGTIIGLSAYVGVLQKIQFIALIKMMGASDFYVVMYVLGQSLSVLLNSFGGAIAVSLMIFPYFPRTVLLNWDDAIAFFLIVVCVVLAASMIGVRKALQVEARAALG